MEVPGTLLPPGQNCPVGRTRAGDACLPTFPAWEVRNVHAVALAPEPLRAPLCLCSWREVYARALAAAGGVILPQRQQHELR